MSALKDRRGDRYGRLTVARRMPSVDGKVIWGCDCDCGARVEVRSGDLATGHTSSCGCLADETRATSTRTHGMRRTPTYQSWHGMIRRCSDPTRKRQERYVARGIRVCDRWLTFANFLADMGEKPPGLSIDRFPNNNDGNYEPGNCRWATSSEQQQNRSTTKLNPISVSLIRYMRRRGSSVADLGHAFGVSGPMIRCVVSGAKWSSISGGRP